MKTCFFVFIISLSSTLIGSALQTSCDKQNTVLRNKTRCLYVESSIEPWGADSELTKPRAAEKKSQSLSLGKSVCIGMIHFFQDHISDIDGPRSSFYPTSSQYALDAIKKYGVLKGIAFGCDRLMRENKDWWIYDTTPKYGFDRKIDPVR